MAGKNRDRVKDKQERRRERQLHGEIALAKDQQKTFENDYNLDWFVPEGLQMDCVESFEKNTYTVVDADSGSGKTSVAIWWALHQKKLGNFRQIVFIKNPTEVGDDQIGFLSGSESDKLMAHMDTTKRIFHHFIPKNKLESDMSADRIRMTIPNFLLGASLDHAIVIVDEGQTMSPSTIKLLTERCGVYTKYIILGDSKQTYSVKKRPDGFKDFVQRVTLEHQGLRFSKYEPMVGYVRMGAESNMRSGGSKFINKLYSGD